MSPGRPRRGPASIWAWSKRESLGRKVAPNFLVERFGLVEVDGRPKGFTARGQRADHFLGWDVPHQLILGERAAAESADCGIESPAAGIIGRQNFCRRTRSRAVQMNTNFAARTLALDCCHDVMNQFRPRDPHRVSERNRANAKCDEASN